ncbi:MAG: HD domain-containing protein [Mycoplasmatales bacterium]
MEDKNIEIYVGNKLQNNYNGHDLEHAQRVRNNTQMIINELTEEVNIEVCLIAALVHDLLDKKVMVNVLEEEQELIEFLKKNNVTKANIYEIIKICKTISYSQNKLVASLEGKIVQDADRLDALGAIGIARCIMYATTIHNPLYQKNDDSNNSVIGHFHHKLYKLPELMNTKIAKVIAKQRVGYLRDFERQLLNELIT